MLLLDILFSPTPWLATGSGAVLLTVRLILGGTMVYYGWEKLRDPQANIKDFDENIIRPGWLFGTLVLLTEFFGGLAVIFGIVTSLAAAAIGFEMLVGTIVKKWKWKLSFREYSYDLLLLGLSLVLLAFGSGPLAVTL